MLTATEVERLNELSDRQEELFKPYRFSLYNTPLNRHIEKDKLVSAYNSGQSYNPIFEYKETPEDWEYPVYAFLREIDPTRSVWDYFIYRNVKEQLDSLETLRSHDPGAITARSIAGNGYPTAALVKSAYERLDVGFEDTSAEENNLSAQEASKHLTDALENAGLDDWSVVIDSAMNAKMMVRSIEKQVFIRDDAIFSYQAVKRLLVHEIGTHVFRYVNGENQNFRLLRKAMPGYLVAEEGLATYHESIYGLSDPSTMKKYVLRVIAAHLSLFNDYFTVFATIAKYTDLDEAFDIVTRAKRGFTDTSEFGAHVKDKVYYEGYLRITQHLSVQPDDYMILMCGKISLDMIEHVKTLHREGIVQSPKFVPQMLVEQ